MVIAHESSYGREYRFRVVLTSIDIDNIAKLMHSSLDHVDGSMLALFLHRAVNDELKPVESSDEIGF